MGHRVFWVFFLFALGCSDDGHVVGDATNGGAGGMQGVTSSSSTNETTTTSEASTSATNATASGSDGSVSSSDTGGTGGTGGSSASTSDTSSQATSTSTSDSTASSAGGATAATSTSDDTSSTTGAAGAGNCEPGQVWCPGCTPGTGSCSLGGCPGVACPQCDLLTTLEDCDLQADCHPVFEDPGTCGCIAVGCCARFLRCADGGVADCVGPAACDSVTPFCDSPVYVNAYSGFCYDGCVRAEDCAG